MFGSQDTSCYVLEEYDNPLVCIEYGEYRTGFASFRLSLASDGSDNVVLIPNPEMRDEEQGIANPFRLAHQQLRELNSHLIPRAIELAVVINELDVGVRFTLDGMWNMKQALPAEIRECAAARINADDARPDITQTDPDLGRFVTNIPQRAEYTAQQGEAQLYHWDWETDRFLHELVGHETRFCVDAEDEPVVVEDSAETTVAVELKERERVCYTAAHPIGLAITRYGASQGLRQGEDYRFYPIRSPRYLIVTYAADRTIKRFMLSMYSLTRNTDFYGANCRAEFATPEAQQAVNRMYGPMLRENRPGSYVPGVTIVLRAEGLRIIEVDEPRDLDKRQLKLESF